MRLAGLIASAAVSAVLYGLAFPTASFQWLAWIALVPFLVAVRRATRATALFLAWGWTMLAAYTVGDWFASGISSYFAQPLIVGIGFFFGVSTLMAAGQYMAFAACYRAIGRIPSAATPIVAAAAWVGAELARVKLLTGCPWALIGYSQIGVLPLMQIADATGVYGMSFALVGVNAALAELWLARDGGPDWMRRALGGLGLAGASLAAVLGYGALRLHDRAIAPQGTPVRVGVVQGNLDIGQQWREEFYGRNLDSYLRLTRELLAGASPPAVVFWPENALTFFLPNEPRYRSAIGRVLSPHGAQLVTGGPRWADGDDLTFYSSAFLVSPAGEILAIYDKQRLLPFGEYFPLASLDFLRRRFARVREFAPGAPSPPLPTAIGAAGVTICNEAMFPEIAAERVRAGAAYLVDPANDTWLTPKFSAQQFDIVTLRAVEQRRYLVRASTSGPSAIVDPFGRVLQRTAFFSETALTGNIRASTVVTPYCRFGDLFALACTAVAALAWLAAVGAPRPVAVVARQSA